MLGPWCPRPLLSAALRLTWSSADGCPQAAGRSLQSQAPLSPCPASRIMGWNMVLQRQAIPVGTQGGCGFWGCPALPLSPHVQPDKASPQLPTCPPEQTHQASVSPPYRRTMASKGPLPPSRFPLCLLPVAGSQQDLGQVVTPSTWQAAPFICPDRVWGQPGVTDAGPWCGEASSAAEGPTGHRAAS